VVKLLRWFGVLLQMGQRETTPSRLRLPERMQNMNAAWHDAGETISDTEVKMNRYEAHCVEVLGYGPAQIAQMRESREQDSTCQHLSSVFGDVARNLRKTAQTVAGASTRSQSSAFWSLVFVLEWIQSNPRRLRDNNAEKLVQAASGILKETKGSAALKDWLRALK
jgi:hypothetical protein